MIVVLAEKPSVARDIARVLGSGEKKDGYIDGPEYRVTWAVGHLVELAQPQEIREEWKRWDAAHLPMLPESFPLSARSADAVKQLTVIDRLFNASKTKGIVCATDAGREGQLIFQYIYDFVGCTKPVKRLWISSLTPDAIRKGFESLRPGSDYDGLRDAAQARSIADWVVGMNASRAYSLASGDQCTVGRVQTPTLAMMVAREVAIRRFVASPYREVCGTFSVAGGELSATYVYLGEDKERGPKMVRSLPPAGGQEYFWFNAKGERELRITENPPAERDADLIAARAKTGTVSLAKVEMTKTATPAPLLFDLTELQRVANRLWGWTAAHTLGVAQELYERHKVLSYPRTDSRHLSESVAATLGGIVTMLREQYGGVAPTQAGVAKLGKRYVDDGKVSDHHAIIPTGTPFAGRESGGDAAQLYDLVCRRLLALWAGDAVDATTEVEVRVRTGETEDRYQTKGRVAEVDGWRAVDLAGARSDTTEAALPRGLRGGLPCALKEVQVLDKKTRAPERFTEASLLSAMETAGSALGGELTAAMKERGLGTPATRAATIEGLVAKGYVVRDKKLLVPSERGMALVHRVHGDVASPRLTGEWERDLRLVERGELRSEELLERVGGFTRAIVEHALRDGVAPPRKRSEGAPARAPQGAPRRRPGAAGGGARA